MTIALLVWLGLNAVIFFCGTIGHALERDGYGVIVGTIAFSGNAFFFIAVLMRAVQ